MQKQLLSAMININFKLLWVGLLALALEGSLAQQCSVSDITVEQIKTGTVIGGKPEFQVTLFNACPCPQTKVKLACKGFRTAEKIDPIVLVVAGDECSLPSGSSIAPFSGYGFYYAWDEQFPLNPISSRPQCTTRKLIRKLRMI